MAARQTPAPLCPARDSRLSPRCLVSSPSAALGDVSSPLALSPAFTAAGTYGGGGGADSSFSAASSSRGHSPFGKSSHSRQSSLISSSSANSSFHASGPLHSSAHSGGSGRHFRQRSEPLILEQNGGAPPPSLFRHSRQSSSTMSSDSLGRGGGEAVGGARRKQRHELSWDRLQALPAEVALQQQRASTNFLLGMGSAPKMLSSPTSIDMGYHTLNGENSLSLEPYDTSLNSIHLACPSVSDSSLPSDSIHSHGYARFTECHQAQTSGRAPAG